MKRPPTEMELRVARAIENAAYITCETSFDVPRIEDPIAVASAAIRAMRVPTEAMLKAYYDYHRTARDAAEAIEEWEAMIAAASPPEQKS